ncbi:MAG: PRC-barrel domain-containing protein [Thermacetogeniaceae bacterium]
MRKGREIIGLPVVSVVTGKELGMVEEILWDHQDRRITSLVVGEKKNSRKDFKNSHVVAMEEILGIGEHAVTIERDSLSETEMKERVGRPTTGVKGVPVITTDGNQLGTVEDVVFSETDGKLVGYEISSGLVGDIVSGRFILNPEAVVTWGEEMVIVNSSAYDNGAEKLRGGSDAVSDL